ncbi:unnamed protein product [Parnassius apollo]|uniref:(apollo) hypothetical protein n=1 Tax=Parnassius apollo TaxID=110799 RepID=A0A8S3XK78_PARAO|nr:unnamed protein product [Parnassius apollo]
MCGTVGCRAREVYAVCLASGERSVLVRRVAGAAAAGRWAQRGARRLGRAAARLARPRAPAPAPPSSTTRPPHHPHPHTHQHEPPQRTLTAYVRVKANIPGGALVVCVEARGAPAGEHAAPLQLRLRPRGHLDPPLTVSVRAANSAHSAVRLQGAVRGARCRPVPPALHVPYSDAPRDPCADPAHAYAHNGDEAPQRPAGAHLALLRSQLEPLQHFTEVAQLTLNYGEMWASAWGGEAGEAVAMREVRCEGCVRLGRAALPYSLHLLPGTLRLSPAQLHFVTAREGEGDGEAGEEEEGVVGAQGAVELRAHNECPLPLRVQLSVPPHLQLHFHVTDLTPLVLEPGASAVVARLQLQQSALRDNVSLHAHVTLHTNLSHYTVPVFVYSGRFTLEWEWPWGSAEEEGVSLGVLGTSASRRVLLRLRNAGSVRLCARELRALLPAASAHLALHACAQHRDPPPDHPCRCVEGGETAEAWLTVVAPARGGDVRGELRVRSRHAATRVPLRLRALPGRLAAHPLLLPAAAPVRTHTHTHGEVRVRSRHAATRVPLRLRALPGRLAAHPLLLPAAAPVRTNTRTHTARCACAAGTPPPACRCACARCPAASPRTRCCCPPPRPYVRTHAHTRRGARAQPARRHPRAAAPAARAARPPRRAPAAARRPPPTTNTLAHTRRGARAQPARRHPRAAAPARAARPPCRAPAAAARRRARTYAHTHSHGEVRVRSRHAATRVPLRLRALPGRLAAHPLLLPAAAPVRTNTRTHTARCACAAGTPPPACRCACARCPAASPRTRCCCPPPRPYVRTHALTRRGARAQPARRHPRAAAPARAARPPRRAPAAAARRRARTYAHTRSHGEVRVRSRHAATLVHYFN